MDAASVNDDGVPSRQNALIVGLRGLVSLVRRRFCEVDASRALRVDPRFVSRPGFLLALLSGFLQSLLPGFLPGLFPGLFPDFLLGFLQA